MSGGCEVDVGPESVEQVIVQLVMFDCSTAIVQTTDNLIGQCWWLVPTPPMSTQCHSLVLQSLLEARPGMMAYTRG